MPLFNFLYKSQGVGVLLVFMKFFQIFFALILFITPALSQEIEYGKPADLKGLTRLYIDTNGDIANRDRIIESIEKAKIGITVVDTFAEAQIYLSYRKNKSSRFAGATSTTNVIGDTPITTTSARSADIIYGAGEIAITGLKNPATLRIIMNFEGSKEGFQKHPSEVMAKRFIKAYKEGNGIK